MGLSVIRGGNGGIRPRWDEGAERSVIGAVLLRPEAIARVELQPAEFFDPRNQAIWAAMRSLHAAGRAIDPILVEAELDRRGVRGSELLVHLSECSGIVPTADNITFYADIIEQHAVHRRVLTATSEVLERAKRGDLEGRELAEIAEDVLWPALKVRSGSPASIVTRIWRALEVSYMQETPLARRWLLRHPTRDDQPAPPGYGDGLLPLGKVGIVASEGGVGKTSAMIALAVAVITGRHWLGHFHVDWEARQGKVLLALAEEDHEEVHRRLYAVAEQYGLTLEERQLVADRLIVLPLAGHPVALVGYAGDGRTLTDTPELLDLRRKLAEGGPWSLIVLDPLARWAGADVESDTSVATRFLQALETLTTVPGFPCVLVPHHSSKLARRTGGVDARGVTAITDAARWAAHLRSEGAKVHFQQVKSNYSKPMLEELELVRDALGMLRVPTDHELEQLRAAKEEREEEREATKQDREESKIARLADEMLAALDKAAGPITGQEQLKGLVGGAGKFRSAAIARLIASGRMVLRSENGVRRYVRGT